MQRKAPPRARSIKSATAAAKANAAVNRPSAASTSDDVDSSAYRLLNLKELPKSRKDPNEPKYPPALRHHVVLDAGFQGRFSHVPGAPFTTEKNPIDAFFHGDGTKRLHLPALDVASDDDGDGAPAWTNLLPDAMDGDKISRHRRRRQAQCRTWLEEVIPKLVKPYLAYTHAESTDGADSRAGQVCICGTGRAAKVIFADWEDVQERTLVLCECGSSAEQIVKLGFFPCAPMRPTMVFSMRLLELISIHSLNVAPNSSAWADSLQLFWQRRYFGAIVPKNLRKRLANTLQWFQVLQNRVQARVTDIIEAAHRATQRQRKRQPEPADAAADEGRVRKRRRVVHFEESADANGTEPDGAKSASGALPSSSSMPAKQPDNEPGNVDPPGVERGGQASVVDELDSQPSVEDRRRPAEPAQVDDDDDPLRSSKRQRPSRLLRSRCPLCFGGERPSFEGTTAHVIVCLDACFAQKRRKSADKDPNLSFLSSRFVSPEDVAAMEAEVEDKRRRPAKTRAQGSASRVSDDVLDECESSFIAAQEKVTKASKNYYADTGLMALLCRHDHVIWIVNMTTPGEKQHYALVLLKMLMQELPDDWLVGVLYDIACQLSRSLDKHGFLSAYSTRFSFAVSVFHAYGHQWACQLVFHPRKRAGFGLSDGEGCERFWSAIRRLVAVLRVCGYFRRLFILDRQFDFIGQQGYLKLGKWLAKRWRDATVRLLGARDTLAANPVDIAVLQAEWDAQVTAQLVKPARQSKHAGDKAIDKILLDTTHLSEARAELQAAEKQLRRKADKLAAREVEALLTVVEQTRRDISATRARIKEATDGLGTQSLGRLQQLRGDAYITNRVNARALRARIREAVRSHKFEREKLERSYRSQVMHNKEHTQTKDLVHRREKSIGALVRKYNTIVKTMEALVRQGKTPTRRARAPRRLDARQLFRLDVDDDIWQEDPGLGPQDDGNLPRWQIDDDVKKGIHAMLESKRAEEELERVAAESRALVHWWKEERALVDSIDTVDGVFAEELRRRVAWLDSLAQMWATDLARAGMHANFDTATVSPSTWAPEPAKDAGLNDASDSSDDEEASLISAEEEDEPLAEQLDDAGSDSDDDVPDDDTPPTTPSPATSCPPSPQASSLPAARSSSSRAAAPRAPAPTKLLSVSSSRRTGDAAPTASSSSSGRGAASASSSSSTSRAGVAAASSTSTSTSSRRAAPPTSASSPAALALPKTRAFSPSAIDISSSEDAPPSKESGRCCGPYSCTGEDVLRFATRQGWLSGDGLAVLSEAFMAAANRQEVAVVPSSVFLDLIDYDFATEAGDASRRDACVRFIDGKLRKAQVPPPATAVKWLVVVHITSPKHWTLLEIRWGERHLRFYDSYSESEGYAKVVEQSARTFLTVCEQLFACPLEPATWRWVPEQRPARQTNWYDCGPFIAADLRSLLTSDTPSTMTQRDMREWRSEMAAVLRSLPVIAPRPGKGKGKR